MCPDSGRIHKYLIKLDNNADWMLALHQVTTTEMQKVLLTGLEFALKEKQFACIQSIADERDVMGILPTGYRKTHVDSDVDHCPDPNL